MGWYKTGTVSVTNGSTAVSGSGTSWVANASVGMGFVGPDGKTYEIASVSSDTSITLGSSYSGSTSSGASYAILPTQDYVRTLASNTATLISDYSTFRNLFITGTFSAGSTSLPGINFSGTGNGLYYPSTNVLGLVTNSTERLRVDASGNLGVGTSAPSYKMHANGTGATVVGVQGTTDASFITNVNGTQALYLHSTATTSEVNELRAVPLLFTVNGSERVRIDASGNLGIGVTPSVKLHVKGSSDTLRIETTTARGGGNGFVSFYDPTGRKGYFGYGGGTDELYLVNELGGVTLSGTAGTSSGLRVDASNNVGIGVSSLTHKLQVDGNVHVPLSRSFYCYNTRFGMGTPDGSGLQVFTSTGDTIRFGQRDGSNVFTERMRIDDGGNVGIGGSPSAKLDVIGATDISSAVRTTGTSNSASFLLSNGNGTTSAGYSYLRFLNNASSSREWRLGTYGSSSLTIRDETAGANRVVVDTSGNVGIGNSTPSSFLYNGLAVGSGSGDSGLTLYSSTTNAGAITFADAGSGVARYAGFVQYTHSNDTLQFGTISNERMRITSNGDVLIGTTTSAYTTGNRNVLEVNGTSSSVVALKAGDTPYGYFAASAFSAELAAAGGVPLIITAGGAERVRVDTSGNVGIGTSSPVSNGRTLTISNSGTSNASLYLQNSVTGSANTDGFSIQANGSNTYLWNYENVPLILGTDNVERVRVDGSGRTSFKSDAVNIANAKTPASASASGTAGDICWDPNYVYVCVATNTWKRAALSTW